MTFAELRAQMDDLPVTLSTVDRDTWLNEGYRTLATESGFTQRTENIGPAVPDQESYDAPEDLHEPIRVEHGDRTYRQTTDREQFREVADGQRDGRGDFFQVEHNGTNFNVNLAPAPTGASGIDFVYVYRPADLTDPDDEPELPAEFHRAIIDYAKSVAYGMPGAGSSAEQATFYATRFAGQLAMLRDLRLARTGTEPRDALRQEATA